MPTMLDRWMHEIYKESSESRRFLPLSSFELARVILGNVPLKHLKEEKKEGESDGRKETFCTELDSTKE